MRQGFRLLARPGEFFNQLQWSTHHWLILIAFLGLAAVEAHVGRHQEMYRTFAVALQNGVGLSLDASLWIVTALRLVTLIIGAWAVSSAIWLVGNLFGRRTSHRVLFRRLAVVFTVFLAGYTAQHFTNAMPILSLVQIAMYVWAILLGYFAIREQFALNHLETVVVGLFALLLVTSAWHFTNHVAEAAARAEVAKVQVIRPTAR